VLPGRVVRLVPDAPLAAVTDAAARVVLPAVSAVPQAASGERPVASGVLPLAVSDVPLAVSGGRPAGSRDARSAELPAALWAA
jgi:hypothetical protein